MKVVDLNLLLYAINRDSPYHEAARSWLQSALAGGETLALPWVVILGFLRLSTSTRIFPHPLEHEVALDVMEGWLSAPAVQALAPGPDHWRLLRQIVLETGAAGNLTTDAHIAALGVENGAELASTDSDFARFPHLRWINPTRR